MMSHRSSMTACILLLAITMVASLAGCKSADQYKAEADEQSYKIIDSKWDDSFGSKANFKISDVEPDPNAIAPADPNLPLPPVLTLPQAVALATANNRDYQTEKELLYTSALDLGLRRHDFENQYFGGRSFTYTRDGISRNEAIAGEANFGFNRLLTTGARISTRVAVSWADILLGNQMGQGFTPLLGISVIQPLLRGSSEDVILENLTQAERDTLYQIRSFNRYRKEFVVDVITRYYQILQVQDTMENAKKNYKTMVWVYGKTKLLSEAGRIPKYEADRAKSECLKALDTYVQARKLYEESLDDYKIVLGIPTTADISLDDKEIEQLRKSEMPYPEFAESDAVETALQRRLDLVNVADSVIDAQRKVKVAEDSLRSELNIGANLSDSGRRHGEFYDFHPLGDQVDAALELNLPLERESEKNIYRKALIAVTQRQREYELAKDTTALEVRQAYRDLKEAAERYRIQQESLTLAKKRFRDTYLMLQHGRASSRRMITAQDDLYAAQNSATEALVSYTVATLKFYRDTGVIRVEPDGMWIVASE